MLSRHGSGAATPRQQSDTPLIRISLSGAFTFQPCPRTSPKSSCGSLSPKTAARRAQFSKAAQSHGPGRMMTIKDRHWRSIRPKATSMTMPVIIPTSSAAVTISIISRAPSRQTMGRSRDLIQLCAVFLRGCVSYFTLRISLILKDPIKDLYKRLLMKAAAAPVGTLLGASYGRWSKIASHS
jgi:hypothetical protein